MSEFPTGFDSLAALSAPQLRICASLAEIARSLGGVKLATVMVMAVRHLDRRSWREELDRFSRQHEGWIVSISKRDPQGSVVIAAHDVPLQGVSHGSPRSDDIAIVVGDSRNHLRHEVHDPTALRIDLTADDAERALIICGHDGTTTTIEFRSPMRTEDVDGLPIHEHH